MTLVMSDTTHFVVDNYTASGSNPEFEELECALFE